MIENLKIHHFRSHSSVYLNETGRINLILGRNNTGKTAALEALFLLLSPANPKEALLQLNDVRGYTSVLETGEMWGSVFYNWDIQKSIHIEVEDNLTDLNQPTIFQRTKRQLAILPILGESNTRSSGSIIQSADFIETPQGLLFKYASEGIHSFDRKVTDLGRSAKKMAKVVYLTDRDITYLPARRIQDIQEMALLYSQLEIANLQEPVIDAIRIIEPNLKKIIVIATRGGSTLYGDIGSAKLMPLPLMGEGMLHTLAVVLAIAKTRGGVVLIDEIENGLHHSVLDQIWQVISKMSANLRVQIFAATHSDECIQSAYNAMEKLDSLGDLRLFRFDMIKGVTRVVDYTAHELKAAIASDQEVR